MKKIEAYKSNKDLEIEKIINEYSGYVYTIIINMSKGILSDEDVEEIISDVFFILWKNRDKLDDEKRMNIFRRLYADLLVFYDTNMAKVDVKVKSKNNK